MTETENLTPQKIEANLSQFIGTKNYYINSLNLRYTDGVKYLADVCEAYWLIDAIASYQPKLKEHAEAEHFQLWELIKKDNSIEARLTCRLDSDQPELVRQEIKYTDFPLNSIKLYLESGVLLLPSEH